jgi:hypothetical protein
VGLQGSSVGRRWLTRKSEMGTGRAAEWREWASACHNMGAVNTVYDHHAVYAAGIVGWETPAQFTRGGCWLA